MTDIVEAEDGITGNLATVRTYTGTRRRIRITIERFSMLTSAGQAYYRELVAVLEHLRGGGKVGFTADSAHTWAGYSAGLPTVGQMYLATHGNYFSGWAAGTIPGEQVVVESSPKFAITEMHTCTTTGPGNQVNLGQGVIFDFSTISGGFMVRWHRFWPCLKLPQDALQRANLINEHGINWTLDWTLEVDSSVFVTPDDV